MKNEKAEDSINKDPKVLIEGFTRTSVPVLSFELVNLPYQHEL